MSNSSDVSHVSSKRLSAEKEANAEEPTTSFNEFLRVQEVDPEEQSKQKHPQMLGVEEESDPENPPQDDVERRNFQDVIAPQSSNQDTIEKVAQRKTSAPQREVKKKHVESSKKTKLHTKEELLTAKKDAAQFEHITNGHLTAEDKKIPTLSSKSEKTQQAASKVEKDIPSVKTAPTASKKKTPTPKLDEYDKEVSIRGEKTLSPLDVYKPTPPKDREKKVKKTANLDTEFPSSSIGKTALSEGKEVKQKKAKNIVSDTSGVAPPTVDKESVTPVAKVAETQPYSQLKPEIFEMFQKIVGVMLVEKYKGVQKTTVEIQFKHDSVFNGTKIEISHYDTAPHSFNVQLAGDPKAVESFAANMGALESAFTQSKLSFKVNLRTPILKDEEKIFKRKSSKKDAGM